MSKNDTPYNEIIQFWFGLDPSAWWAVSPEFDTRLKKDYSADHAKAAAGEYDSWREHPLGRLAEIIILDQFSRNIFRGTPGAFAHDPLALALSQEAIRAGASEHLSEAEKGFLYMPFMHSESLVIHERAMTLFTGQQLEYEKSHQKIIQRFGRYPHRNDILSRPSTPEEVKFLTEPNSSF